MRKTSTQLDHQLLAWRPDLVGTLVYLLRNNPDTQQAEVLLIEKQSGHGQGLVNGPGGKLEPTETIFACARREMLEEVGIRVQHLRLRARIRFVELSGPQWLGFVFTATAHTGSLTASPEAIPAWYPITNIPWSRMWPSDQLWLPKVLEATPIEVNLLFDAGDLIAKQVIPRFGE